MRTIPHSWTILRVLRITLAIALGSSGAQAADTAAAPTLTFEGARRDLEDTIIKGRNTMTPVAELTWFTPLKGGVPVVIADLVVGGNGVSGAASAQQDDEIATAGAQAFASDMPAATVPQRVSTIDVAGSTVWFQPRLDDYAEIWVNGELARAYDQRGGSLVAGWNAANRLILGRAVKPGQHIQIAVFGINGPISEAPPNYIFVREARLEFVAGSIAPVAVTPQEVSVRVERVDSRIDALDGLRVDTQGNFYLCARTTLYRIPLLSTGVRL